MNRLGILLLLLLLLPAGCSAAGEEPAVLFLRHGPNGAAQIYRQSLDDISARQLTGVDDPSAGEVIDFAAAPDGERIAYARLDGADGSSLHLMAAGGGDERLLAGCPTAECSGIVWSPDARRLIYESRPIEGGLLGSPRLFWLDPDSGQTAPLIEGGETPGYGARFSPDGTWLSYVSLADDGVVLYHLAEGAQRLLTSRVGSPAAWSPSSVEVVYGDISVQGYETAPESEGIQPPVQEASTVYLYRTIVTEDAPRQRLSPDAGVADSVPAYSPDGQWIAFGRAPANTGAGRQLWLMRPDGVGSRTLTADPAVTHGPPSWSPDGRYLLFQRYPVGGATGLPSVWLLEVATGEERLLAESGYLPAWLP